MTRRPQPRRGRRALAALTLPLLLLAGPAGCDPSIGHSDDAHELSLLPDLAPIITAVDERLSPLVDELIADASRQSLLQTRLTDGSEDLSIAPAHLRGLHDFYAQRGYHPIFTAGRHLNDIGIGVAQMVIAADAHGLDPERYHVPAIRAALEGTLSRADLPTVQGELRLSAADRDQLAAWLSEQRGADGSIPDVRATLQLIVHDSERTPLPSLTRVIQRRLAGTVPAADAGTSLELLLADAFLRWSIDQRFANLRYITTEMAHARGWRILVDGEVYSTRQPGSPRAEAAIDPSLLRDIDAETVALTFALEYLQDASDAGTIEASMEAIAPPFEDYHRLVAAAKQYRRYAMAGGWETLSGPADLRSGANEPRVAELKARLAAEGYFHGDIHDPRFDRELRSAVLQYQETHQLQLSGTLSQETLDSLNVSATRRYAQILVTLDRWRETRVGEDFDDEYIHVNVPDFHAELWAEGERVHRFKTIVGSTRRWRDENGEMQVDGRTVLFSDELQYIVYNPYWNVPYSLWRRDYAEKIAEDPFWLLDNGYEIVPTPEGGELLRQLPGPENALGMVKFLFPNEHNIYLHDTPGRHLFNSNFRNFSYGCVRIEDALGFAALLTARDRGISLDAANAFIEKTLAEQTEQWTTLRTYIPVHIEYYTVRVDDQGYTNFLADFHRYDSPLVDELEATLERQFQPQLARTDHDTTHASDAPTGQSAL